MESGIKDDYRIGVIGTNLLTKGLQIAGIREVHNVATTADAEAALRALMSKEGIGIIVITKGVMALVKDRHLKNLVDTSLMPLIVEVPGYNEVEEGVDPLRRLILRAIGIDINET